LLNRPDFVEAFAFYPEKIHPATKFTWIGAYASQHVEKLFKETFADVEVHF